MATTKATQRQAAEEAPAPKKGKKRLLLILIIVLVLAGGGGGAYEFLLAPHPAAKRHHGPPPPGPTYTFPQLTTNLDDGHIVQLSMVLQLASGDTTTEVSHDLAELNNAAILTFGQMSYEQLLPTAGREAAASALEGAFNQVLARGASPHDEVVGIEFTSFIVQ